MYAEQHESTTAVGAEAHQTPELSQQNVANAHDAHTEHEDVDLIRNNFAPRFRCK